MRARDDAGDDLRHFLVNQRLAARNGHDGRAAFVDRAQGVLDADPLLQDLLRIIDLTATGAGEIALEQGFQHQHQGIALVAAQLAPGDIARNLVHLQQWNGHALSYRGRVSSPIRLQSQHLGAVIAPDPCPFELEPGGKVPGALRRHFPLQRLRATQRQATNFVAYCILTESVQRPMNTEHSSFSAPVSSNCAWYWNLNRSAAGSESRVPRTRRRWMAASMASAPRGWLQQLFDQYSGQRRLRAERC